MTELAESGVVYVGLGLLIVAIVWTGSGKTAAVMRVRLKHLAIIFLVLALVVYFAAGFVATLTL